MHLESEFGFRGRRRSIEKERGISDYENELRLFNTVEKRKKNLSRILINSDQLLCKSPG